MKNFLVLPAILFLMSCKQANREKTVTYDAGFKTLHATDKSRIYKPDTDTTNYLHYRPLDLDIWYPAGSKGADPVLLLRDILGLLDERANYYTASHAGDGLASQIAKYFCDGVKCSDTTRLLNFKTKSVLNAPSIAATFPLVIYLCAYNGMSYENFSLFEDLAMKGFVVVSISSIGRYPGDMTMKKEDLMEQVKDAVAAVQILKQEPNIDFSKVGIVGYSWGGLAGAMLANKIPGTACLISLDGSEFHHYGEAKEENEDFNGIRNSDGFRSMRLRIPYLRLESSPSSVTPKEDSIYNFLEKLSDEKLIFKINSAQHEDFGCMPAIVKASGRCKDNGYYNTILKLTVSYLEEHLKDENVFAEASEQELNKTITRN